MEQAERGILEALDAVVRSAAPMIEPLIASASRKLQENPAEVLAWEVIPLDRYDARLPDSIRSSWVFILRANVVTGAERHPNSHQRMMSYRGHGDFQTQPEGEWRSHLLTSDSSAALEERWISIPSNVWHQGVVSSDDWVVVSFHTVPANQLIEERPATDTGGQTRQRWYAPSHD